MDVGVFLGTSHYGDGVAVAVELVVDSLHERPGANQGLSLGLFRAGPPDGAATFAKVLLDALFHKVADSRHGGLQVACRPLRNIDNFVKFIDFYVCVDKICHGVAIPWVKWYIRERG